LKPMNKMALDLLMDALDQSDKLRIKDVKIGGATVVDMGVKERGSIEAGIILAKICMGGLAEINITDSDYGGLILPTINQYTDYPVEACMASQLAGWKVSVGDYFAMGSGPARVLARKPKKLFKEIGYTEEVDEAVLVLEVSKLPTEEVVAKVSETTNVSPHNLYIAVAATNSIAGSIQISARIVETAIHKLHTLGFELNDLLVGWGRCPISPQTPDELIMLGRTNDMLLYGGEVTLLVDYKDDEKLKEYVSKTPSTASKDYGVSLAEKIKEIGMEFLYKVDPTLFAPAVITINNVRTGYTYSSGQVNIEVLKKSVQYIEL